MKKLLTLPAIVALLIVAITSCGPSEKQRLAEMAARAAAEIPVTLGISGEITAIGYTDDNNLLTMTIHSQPNSVSVNAFAADPTLAREMLECRLSQAYSNRVDSLLRLAVAAEASLEAVFTDAITGDKATVTLPPSEIDFMLKHPIDESKQRKAFFDNEIALLNSRCPISAHEGDGIRLAEVALEGAEVVMTFEFDSGRYTIDHLSADPKGAKDLFLKVTKSQYSPLLKYMVEQNKGMRYVIRDPKGGKEFTISQSVGEISWLERNKPEDI